MNNLSVEKFFKIDLDVKEGNFIDEFCIYVCVD